MSGWKTARLDACCEIVSGATPNTAVAAYWGGDICWATPKDMSGLEDSYISDTPRKLTRDGLNACASTILPAMSVLFSSRAPIGHVAVNTVPMATNQGFKSFIPKVNLLDAKFLYWWLKANRAYLESLGNGATFKEVSKSIISRIEVPLPPLPEQRRIADILDRAEALRAKRREALAELDDLTQAIFIDMFGDPAENSKGFPTVPLGDVIKLRSGFAFKSSHYVESGVPLIRMGEVNSGVVDRSKVRFLPNEYATSYSRFIVHPGDILMSMTGTTGKDDYGNVIMLDSTFDTYLLNQRVACLSPDSGVLTKSYLFSILQHGKIKARLISQSRGVRQANISNGDILGLMIPTPPLSLQNDFSYCLSVIKELKLTHSDSLIELDALFASLQHRAFRGEL